ncbi:MAG: DUF3179 domain-containing protein [Candidatus Aenigmarchaeota archaeon]|nr:DUF3179 domain-containing protein [Candidatus Aenigmarchaeota archaeon]
MKHRILIYAIACTLAAGILLALFALQPSVGPEGKAPVYGIALDGSAKAYLKAAVARSGIINDAVGSQRVLLVWNQSTQSAMAFDRIVNGNLLTFEKIPSGIRDNTGNEWGLDGTGRTSGSRGLRLARIPVNEQSWASWKAQYPGSALAR